MESYQREFIEFLVRSDVLRFGDFTTKSGRRTPYFIDTGRYRTGAQIHRLAGFYAQAILAREDLEFDVLFGPAYKGIPLVVATSLVLSAEFGRDVAFCFDRKEEKDHGEGGRLVGHAPRAGDRVLLVEDVTTAGTSIRQTVPLLRRTAGVELAGLVVSVDRMEKGPAEAGETSALRGLSSEFSMPAFAIVTIEDVVEHLAGREIDGEVVLDDERRAAVTAYRERYGAV